VSYRASRKRLSLMMFLQYAAPGVFIPILSHYLKNYLLFTPFQVGVILAMPAVAAIIAPFPAVWAADRLIAAERLLGVCHFCAGIVMLWLSQQKHFLPFLSIYFIYGLLFAPTFALTNAVSFHHIEDAKRDFGAIRMWGPISWVVVGWGFSMLWLRNESLGAPGSRLPHALIFSGIASMMLGAYAFALPKGKKTNDKPPSPLSALSIFTQRNMLILCGVTLLNAAVHQFYYYGMSPYLNQIGLSNQYILPAMSLGQLGEIFMLFSLGFFLRRLGIKTTLVIGVLSQAIRCAVFAFAGLPWVLAVIPSHGICYAFFFTTAFIYVDLHSTAETRAGAQQLFNLLISGFGTLLGNLIAGKMATLFFDNVSRQIDFTKFWSMSILGAVTLSLVLILFFHEEKEEALSQ